LSHKKSEIDFDSLDPVTLVVGIDDGDPARSNGAGKSSIFDALTWVLFEKSRATGSASTGIDNVVRQGQDVAEVEFQFEIDGALYRIVRSRNAKRKQSSATFHIKSGSKWSSIAEDTKKLTNAKIVRVIGVDYEIFVNSVLLEQHDAAMFATMTPGERKDVVASILQLNNYNKYSAAAKAKCDEISIALDASDRFIEQHSSVDKDKAEAELNLKSVEGQIKAKQKGITAKQNIIDDLRTDLAKQQGLFDSRKDEVQRSADLKQQVGEITKRIKQQLTKQTSFKEKKESLEESTKIHKQRVVEIKEQRGDPSTLKRDLKQWKENKEAATTQVNALTVKVDTAAAEIRRLTKERKRVVELNEGKCPVCYGDVTTHGKDEIANELDEKLAIYDKQSSKYASGLQDAKKAKTKAAQMMTELDSKREVFNRLQNEAKLLVGKIKDGRERLQEYDEAHRDAGEQLVTHKEDLTKTQLEIQKSLDKLETMGEFDDQKLNDIRKQLAVKKGDIDSETRELSTLQMKTGTLQERIRAMEDTIKLVKEKREQRSEEERKRRVYKELTRAFGKEGIQALIMENSAIEIEKIANNLLGEITDGRVKIQIETQKENKDGSIRETFDIIITDEYHSSPFAMYSGGEKFRIALAIRIALSILLSRRSGVKVSAIFYDEAFGSLDRDGTDRLMHIFQVLAKDFRHQILVTHQTELKQQFTDILVVHKTKDGSFIAKS